MVCPGMAAITSILTRSNPCFRTSSYVFSNSFTEWSLPNFFSSSSQADCIPRLIRVTPASLYRFSFSSVTELGLHSMVNSFKFSDGIHFFTEHSSLSVRSISRKEGVPPPMKRVSASLADTISLYNCISRSNRLR